MASYTDKGINFAPYVQQLPLESMLNVGTIKQGQYNQGVQKIQSSIDSVAGLDIIRDVDKGYLQSKLDTLGNNLKAVAAADFSNYQLTNSVAGMANQIGKDSVIQNAVSSTARVRKAISNKDAANKAGKGAPENEWYLDREIGGYLNNPDLKASFSGDYIPYRDVKTKMLEVLKTLHESGKEEQIPWVIGADGKPDMNQTAAAMVEKGWKGITSGQIENAVRAAFDEGDLRQMQISGEYQFKDYSPEDLVKHAQLEYSQQFANAQNKIAEMYKYAEMHKNANDLSEYNQAMTAIKEMEASIGEGGDYRNQLKEQYDGTLAAISRSPDAVKAELYKNGFVKQFANSHSWEETTLKYLTNPYQTQNNWERVFGLDRAKFAETVRHNQQMEANANIETNIKRAEFDMKYGTRPFSTTYGMPQESGEPQERIKSDIQESVNNVNGLVNNLASTIRQNIAKKTGKNVTVTAEDVNRMIDGTYNGPLKNAIPPEYKLIVDQIVEARRQVGITTAVYNDAVAAANSSQEVRNAKASGDSDAWAEAYKTQLDKEILLRTPEYVPELTSLGSSVERKRINHDIAMMVLSRIGNDKGGNDKLDKSTLSTWLTENKENDNLEYSVLKTGKDVKLIVHNGKQQQEMTLIPKEVAQIPEAQLAPDNQIKQEMIKLGGTTNAAGGNPMGAKWKNLPGIKNMKVVGDIRTLIGSDMVLPEIQVQSSDGSWIPLIYNTPMSIIEAGRAFNGLTDKYIEEQVKKQHPEFKGKIYIQ